MKTTKLWVTLLVLGSFLGCATVPTKAVPADEMPTGPNDKAVALKTGEVLGYDAVCMTPALATFKAKNCAEWERAGTACLSELRQKPSSLDKTVFWTALVVGVGVLATGAGLAAGYAVAK